MPPENEKCSKSLSFFVVKRISLVCVLHIDSGKSKYKDEKFSVFLGKNTMGWRDENQPSEIFLKISDFKNSNSHLISKKNLILYVIRSKNLRSTVKE